MEISRSKITIFFLSPILVGIFLANFVKFDLYLLAGILIGLVFGLVIFWINLKYRFYLFIVLGFVIGSGYYSLWDNGQNAKRLVYGQQFTVQVSVIEKPVVSKNIQRLIVGYNQTKIQVEIPEYPKYSYGDEISFEGKIQDPHEIETVDNFNYGHYLLKKGIRGVVKNPLKLEKVGWTGNPLISSMYKVGDKFEQSLNKTLSEPYASFQAGLVIGSRSNIPDSLVTSFNKTGTTHLIAVSGYNITIIISAIAILFALFSRRVAFWGTILVILGFVVLTGGSASVVRAGILGGLVALGKLEGRRINHTILLLFTAVTMLLFNPYALMDDISFELSFLAFAGMIYVSPIMEKTKILKLVPEFFRKMLSETLSAQVLVLPILIYYFGTLSLISPLANILVLPFIPMAMFLGIFSGIVGIIWLKLGILISFINWLVLKYILIVIENLGNLNWSAISLKAGEWWWIPSYYLIVLILLNKKRKVLEEIEEL